MKIKTSELSGDALDYAVAVAEGYEVAVNPGPLVVIRRDNVVDYFNPSINWGWGGPIIDEHDITVGPWTTSPAMAYIGPEVCWGNPRVIGPTKLVAAMRCFVRSVLGEEIDLPQAVIDIS